MGFFAEFNAWLNALLVGYIGANVSRIAATLEPAIVTLAVVYVMVWGYLQLTGQIEEPFIGGLKRIITLAVVLGSALALWLYNSLIVGAFDPVGIVDQIIFEGGDAANLLLEKGGLLDGNFAYYLAGIGVYLIVGLTAIYTIFLLALSRIALSVLLALGPLFIALLLFNSTKRFFEAWIAQLANYAFIALLAVLVAALMLRVVRVCMAAGLTFLVMRQVMPMAAGLASGLALSSFGVVSAALAWGLGSAARGTRQFGRGLFDRDTSRSDPLSRKAGYALRRGVIRAVSRPWRENQVRRSA